MVSRLLRKKGDSATKNQLKSYQTELEREHFLLDCKVNHWPEPHAAAGAPRSYYSLQALCCYSFGVLDAEVDSVMTTYSTFCCSKEWGVIVHWLVSVHINSQCIYLKYLTLVLWGRGGSNLPPCNLPEVQPLFSLFQPYSLGHLEKGFFDIFADLLSFQEIAEWFLFFFLLSLIT